MAHEQFIRRLFELQETNFTVVDMQQYAEKKRIELKIWHKPEGRYFCGRCGELHTKYYDKREIVLHDVPIGEWQVVWKVQRVRVDCSCHHVPVVEQIPFRSEEHQLTRRMQEYTEGLLCTKMFTVMDVARLLNLGYGVVYKIDHEVLLELLQHAEIPEITHIGVDEKSFLKGHKYVTLVSCLKRGKVIWAAEGKDEKALDQFFQAIGPERAAKIEFVTRDESPAYIASLHKNAPNALQVSDKFHVVKKLGEAIDQVRRDITKQGEFAKNSMWVLRKREKNLSDKQRIKLEELKKDNEPLYELYLIKENFFEFFEYPPKQIDKAEGFLNSWLVQIGSYGLEPLNKFIEHVVRHKWSILNIVRTGFTNATAEGLNRKINVLKAMAYGYKNVQYFMLKILQRCGILGQLYKDFSRHNPLLSPT
jgi:transposase